MYHCYQQYQYAAQSCYKEGREVTFLTVVEDKDILGYVAGMTAKKWYIQFLISSTSCGKDGIAKIWWTVPEMFSPSLSRWLWSHAHRGAYILDIRSISVHECRMPQACWLKWAMVRRVGRRDHGTTHICDKLTFSTKDMGSSGIQYTLGSIAQTSWLVYVTLSTTVLDSR